MKYRHWRGTAGAHGFGARSRRPGSTRLVNLPLLQRVHPAPEPGLPPARSYPLILPRNITPNEPDAPSPFARPTVRFMPPGVLFR